MALGLTAKPNNNVHVLLRNLKDLLALGTGIALGDFGLNTDSQSVALQWSGAGLNGAPGFAQVGSQRGTAVIPAGVATTDLGGAGFVFKAPEDGMYSFQVCVAVAEGPTVGKNTNGAWAIIRGGVISAAGVATIIGTNVTENGFSVGMGALGTPVAVTASGGGLLVAFTGVAATPACLASCSVYFTSLMAQP